MLGYTADAPQYPPPDPGLAAQWRTKLDPRDVALVESRIGAMLRARGYASSGYRRPKISPVRHRLLLAEGRLLRSSSNRR